jgi:hypothetical protein
MADIFVNYRSSDEPFAATLVDEKLCERFGPERVFRDNRAIGLGLDYRPVLWDSLDRSLIVVAIIGPKWHEQIHEPDDFVRRELATALRGGHRVVPVLVGSQMRKLREEDLPDDLKDLAHRQYLRLQTRAAQNDIALLVDRIAEIIGPTPSTVDRHSGPRHGTVALIEFDDTDASPHQVVLSERADRLRAAIDFAAAQARLKDVEVLERSHGYQVFVPRDTPPIRVAVVFTRALDRVLRDASGPRVRMAVQRGVLGGDRGDVVDELDRFVAQPVLDVVLRQASRAHVVLAVPDDLYDTEIRTDPRTADLSTYAQVPGGRLHVPGYPHPPGLAPFSASSDRLEARPSTKDAGPNGSPGGGAPVFDNHGTVNGGMGNTYHVGGDHVMGDKYEVRRP